MSELEQLRTSSAAKALVVCIDARTIEQLGEVLQAMRIDMEACVDAQAAIRRLGREKFDAVVFDWFDRSTSSEILRFVRQSSSNKTDVVFAITRNSSQAVDAFKSGVTFVIEYPIFKPRLERVLKAAYGLILRERRRYFRFPVVVPVFLSKASGPEIQTVSLNISERGIALVVPDGLNIGDEVGLRLQLPDVEECLRMKAQVCWVDGGRRAGLQFTSVPVPYTELLQEWLARRLEDCSSTTRAEHCDLTADAAVFKAKG